MNKLRLDAEKLRAQGYSYALIKEKLGISKSTMSYWFKDKPFTPNMQVEARIKNGRGKVGIKRHNIRVREIKKLKELGIKEVGKLSDRDLWMLGLGLYIGEGAKTTETIHISNSDPLIIMLSIRWFKEVLGLSNDNLVIRLHLYPDSNVPACIEYWQSITGLEARNFYQSIIDMRVNKKVNRAGKLPYGTAQVSIKANGDRDKGVRLYRKMSGWIEGAMNQTI